MAQKVRIELVSDLSGDTLAENEGETIRFGLDGKEYEIDLSTKEASDLRSSLDSYVSVARKSNSGSKTTRNTSGSPSRGADKERMTSIRNWAEQNGHKVNSRGRIKAEVVEAFDAAHEGK